MQQFSASARLGSFHSRALCSSRAPLHLMRPSRCPAAAPQVWVGLGDIILVSLREYQDDKGDVIVKFSAEEARELKAMGEIPEHTTINETTVGPPAGAAGEEGGFEFGEASDSSDGEDVDVDAV